MDTTIWLLEESDGQIVQLPNGGSLAKRHFRDAKGMSITILELSNGSLSFSVIPERGMDVGEIRLGSDKMSWDRSERYLLHPANVDLEEGEGTGWLNGFYGAVASIGPELFGTPGEGFTLHGSASYSLAVPESVQVTWDEESIHIQGQVSVSDQAGGALFAKRVVMSTRWGSSVILREERTTNVSGVTQVIDDGYHIQLSGTYVYQGGRYVLSVRSHELLLRDSAPPEEEPFRIPSIATGQSPLRCYQYVPRPVNGLHQFEELAPHLARMDLSRGITAEMIINDANTQAGFVVRPLIDFPRSLIAKQIGASFMFAIEPCRTRPNRMSQKKADGEALYVRPGKFADSHCIIGLSNCTADIAQLESFILSAAEKW